MNLILIIFALLPQDYINLLMLDNYEAAINYCEEMKTKSKGFGWHLELGDIYFFKLDNLDKAKEIYQEIINNYHQQDGRVHYRLAMILERKEDYLNAAKQYEIVATQFRKFPIDSFALAGVERCFKKNYQDYVASIGGYNITRLELDERMAKGSPFARRNEKEVLDQMILERLLYVNALKHKINEGESFKANLRNTKKSLLLEEVRAVDIVAKAIPTEKEMKSYYRKNRENFKTREEIRGKEIVVESDSLAKFLHDSLTKDISSFDTLAKLYSTAPTKGSGGNMGVVYKDTRPKEIEKVLFKTEPNKLTGIVPHQNKFGIYLITDHKPERYRTFEEVKSQIETQLKAEKMKKVEEKFVKRLRKDAKIEIYHDSISQADSLIEGQNKIVAVVNGRTFRRQDIAIKAAQQPALSRVDLTQPEQFEKTLNSVIEEDLKLEWAERQKYYLNETYFTKLQEAIKRTLDQGLYTKIVVEAVSVDSNEIKEHYKKHKEDMKIPETVRAREIVVNSKELGQKIHRELLSSYGAKSSLIPFLRRPARVTDLTKFEELAKEHSIAPTKARGGDTGPLRRGIRPKQFDDIAFKLKPGTISNLFQINDTTYTIITVVERTPATYRPIAEVWQSIESSLRREKQHKVSQEFLARIKAEADIKILLPEPAKEEEKEPVAPKD